MCGLVGWITSEKGSDSFDRRKFIDMALILDTIRGGDGTGVFVVPNWWKPDEKPWANWRKQASGGHEFIITPEYKKLFENGAITDYKFCVGHNRSATVGGVSVDAAHPFVEGPITLVHNGTVKKEFTTEAEIINDSHGICWRLSKDKPEDVIKDLDGAFALIWHDARDDSLNFVRNAQRPLHMAKVKGQDTIYFASEAEMLFWLDRKLSLKLQDIVSMKPAHWLKFRGPKLMVPEVKQVEMYSPPKAKSQAAWTQQSWSGTGQNNAGGIRDQAAAMRKWMGGSSTKHPGHKPSKTIEKEIPEKLQEDLLEHNLFVEQEEEFVPMQYQEMSWHGKGREVGSILGWIIPQDKTWNPLPAVLHGVAPHVWQHSKNRIWTVHPLGMTRMGWDLPCVVARLRGTFDITGKLRTIPDDKKPPEIGPDTKVYARRATYIKPPLDESKQHAVPFDDSIEHIGEADPDSVEYPGPRHLMLSLSAWLIATKQGCMSCGNPLHPRTHAWSLQWVETDQGVKPICDSCIDIKSAEDDEIVTQGGG